MARRSTISQAVRIALEATAGTSPTATSAYKELGALGIELSPNVEVSRYRPRGSKYTTVSALGKQYASASLSGLATYNEMQYPLSSVLDTAGVATVAATGTHTGNSYTWTFEPARATADAPKSFTVYTGDAVTAERIKYFLVNNFTLTGNRNELSISGNGIGQIYQTGQTLIAAGGGAITLKPILPDDGNVYLNPSYATLGNTKITNVLEWSWNIGPRFGMFWPIDSSQTSWADFVEVEPAAEVTLTVEGGATAMGWKTTYLETGDPVWVRIKYDGTEIGNTNVNYLAQFDFKLIMTNMSELTDNDGVLATTFTFAMTPESNWAGPMKVTLKNDRSAL